MKRGGVGVKDPSPVNTDSPHPLRSAPAITETVFH